MIKLEITKKQKIYFINIKHYYLFKIIFFLKNKKKSFFLFKSYSNNINNIKKKYNS